MLKITKFMEQIGYDTNIEEKIFSTHLSRKSTITQILYYICHKY